MTEKGHKVYIVIKILAAYIYIEIWSKFYFKTVTIFGAYVILII